jgi:hypothetical protein
MQTSPNSHGRLQTIKAALRGWFIKIGLVPPPEVSNNKEKQLSGEQNRHKWICACTNNENQGIGEYPLNLLSSFKFYYEKQKKKTPGI